MMRLLYLGVVFLCACARPSNSPPATGPATGATSPSKSVPLPGVNGPVTLDYIVYDHAHERVWIPVGESGSADIFDIGASSFQRVDGFATAPREVRGRKRMMGPSAAAVGDGFVYIGNRATSEVCVVDESTLALGHCLKLSAPTDGVAYVPPTKEVWVTTPKDRSIVVLDASEPDRLQTKLVIKTEGEPEGYAVDSAHGLFHTNLEDENRTLTFDIKTHALTKTWPTGCAADGPRGVAADATRNLVFVACTDSVRILDGAHDGALLEKLDAGAGIDNIDYLESKRLLYVASGKAAHLTVARIDDGGRATVVATWSTSEGARNAVVDSAGNAYVADPGAARLLVFHAPAGQDQ